MSRCTRLTQNTPFCRFGTKLPIRHKNVKMRQKCELLTQKSKTNRLTLHFRSKILDKGQIRKIFLSFLIGETSISLFLLDINSWFRGKFFINYLNLKNLSGNFIWTARYVSLNIKCSGKNSIKFDFRFGRVALRLSDA